VKYVLDSCVALKWVLPEADSGKAIRLRDEYGNGVHELLAPDVFPSEIANGLVSAEHQKRIRTGESAIFLNDVLRAVPALHPSAPLLFRAMEIALSTKQAVYDCLYVALTEAEGCELVTADHKLVRGPSPLLPVYRLSGGVALKRSERPRENWILTRKLGTK
jgi:predicted nucleic acid-binding protein